MAVIVYSKIVKTRCIARLNLMIPRKYRTIAKTVNPSMNKLSAQYRPCPLNNKNLFTISVSSRLVGPTSDLSIVSAVMISEVN